MASCTVAVIDIAESERETDIHSGLETDSQPISTRTPPTEFVPETEIQPCKPIKEIRLDDCEFLVIDEVGSPDERGHEASSPIGSPRIGETNKTEDAGCIDADPAAEKKSSKDQVNNDFFCLDTTPDMKDQEKIASDLFCVDTTPQISTEKERHLGPRYRSDFDAVLTLENENSDPSEATAKVDNGNRCFNCLGDHSVANCPKPKNQQEIFKNRKLFMNDQSNKQLMNQRYHVDPNNKYDHIKPGEISESLRSALGLRSREVPMFIYRMRVAGYPPGWIEEIKESTSGINLVDSPTSSQSASTKVVYDLHKIVDYPGFNVPLDSYYHDDWYYLNYPPMNPAHAKELLIENLKRENCYQKGNTPEDFSTNMAEVDMDVASDSSIEELEMQRQTLLAQLQEDNEEKDDCSAVADGCCEVDNKDPNESPKEAAGSSTPKTSPSQSKVLEMGTPVGLKFSSFSSLPGLDKFAVNMGDLELFENLPTSTGAFKKMKSLLKKVRNIFKKNAKK